MAHYWVPIDDLAVGQHAELRARAGDEGGEDEAVAHRGLAVAILGKVPGSTQVAARVVQPNVVTDLVRAHKGAAAAVPRAAAARRGDVAEAAAETLLNPKNYTGECSKISLQGARRATRTVGALSDLSSRYNAISELVFHGRADEVKNCDF